MIDRVTLFYCTLCHILRCEQPFDDQITIYTENDRQHRWHHTKMIKTLVIWVQSSSQPNSFAILRWQKFFTNLATFRSMEQVIAICNLVIYFDCTIAAIIIMYMNSYLNYGNNANAVLVS